MSPAQGFSSREPSIRLCMAATKAVGCNKLQVYNRVPLSGNSGHLVSPLASFVFQDSKTLFSYLLSTTLIGSAP